jgi:KDO2-lipid IV(A) lauroyltransferase
MCFGTEMTAAQLHGLARENFRNIGESFACSVKTASLSAAQVREVLELSGVEKLGCSGGRDQAGRVIAIGHFGNFELYVRAVQFAPGFQSATTYRALRQPALNRLLQRLRRQSGCLYFERRSEASALREAMRRQRIMLGLMADQHAGDKGLRLPFLGHECSTSAAPAVFALRYGCPLHPAICYRVGLGRWRIEVGDEIPTREDGHPRPIAAISLDINRAFEEAVRRDPANWFWVHNRWKAADRKAKVRRPAASGHEEPPPSDASASASSTS